MGDNTIGLFWLYSILSSSTRLRVAASFRFGHGQMEQIDITAFILAMNAGMNTVKVLQRLIFEYQLYFFQLKFQNSVNKHKQKDDYLITTFFFFFFVTTMVKPSSSVSSLGALYPNSIALSIPPHLEAPFILL